MNVKLIRMWSGEDVITDLVEEKIKTAEERIKELQRLIEHWKKQQ